MTMTLYQMPGACSRVTLAALEEIGQPYEDVLVHLARGEQKAPAYLALNPRGKVPTLVVDGEPLIENAAILYYLARAFPAAGLLPARGSDAADLRGLSDLIWCSGTLHPLGHRLFRPNLYTSGDPAAVKDAALATLKEQFGKVAATLSQSDWWFGDRWSIVDEYLDWLISGAEVNGFPLGDYPALAEHHQRVAARPAHQRAREREAQSLRRDEPASA